MRQVALATLAWAVLVVAEERRLALPFADARGTASTLAIVAALPLVATVALGTRSLWRHARTLAAVAIGGGAAVLAFDTLRAGRFASRASLAAMLVGAATALAVCGLLALHARARSRAPLLVAAAALAFAVLACRTNASVFPRLYPSVHLGIVGAAMFACAMAADALLELRALRAVVDVASALGVAVLVSLVSATSRAGSSLSQSAASRQLIHERSEMLRPVVRAAAQLWPPPKPAEVAGVDPLAGSYVGARLDVRGRDVVLVTIDALRADHVGAYGYARRTTPNLDAVAQEGVLFEHAYTSAPQTSYAIASIMLGKHVRTVLDLDREGVRRAADVTWAEHFAAAGYRTAAFYPETVFFTDMPRFTPLAERHLGFQHAAVEYETGVDRVSRVIAHVRKLPDDARFFAWVHLFEPHEPYDAHAEHPFGSGEIDRYDAEIAYADAALGTLVREIRALRPDAVFVITADHGEAFGEHGARYHGTTLYEEQVHVPLVVSIPGLANRRVHVPVSTIDLMPTFVSGIGLPRPPRTRGANLGALLVQGPSPSDVGAAFASLPEATLVARGDRRVLCSAAIAACALFDLRDDRAQMQPITSGVPLAIAVGWTSAAVEANRAVEIGP